ncbi:MAG: DUF885 family protein [Gemmatimonadetes bacterium]|nr:DUF885 family protein [Gemmatimonadota bacterium]
MSHVQVRPKVVSTTLICLLVGTLLTAGCSPEAGSTSDSSAGADQTDRVPGTTHADLVTFFEEWRGFQAPKYVDGVPDYSAEAMVAQHGELADWQARLAAFDTTGWSVTEQIDAHVIRTEMNGLDFDHRVTQPWARNPAFYMMIFTAQSDVPAHEGPVVHGWIDTWTYDYPLSTEDAAELAARFGTIPALLDQARANLVGDGRDLWQGGIRSMEGQIRDLTSYAASLEGSSADLDGALEAATQATEEFLAWLENEAPSKTGPSGVGIENYNWYLKNVHLVPYTWAELLAIHRRELARSHAALALEEHRNRNLPRQDRISTAADYDRLFNQAVDDYVAFLVDNQIISDRDYLAPSLRERIGSFQPVQSEDELRGFFSEVSYRDPLTMRTHGHHWFDLAMMAEDPHPSPIRATPTLYNIWDSRAEGMATGMEEWMMNAGLFDDNPRSRELIYILIAQRAARGISGLLLHANEFLMEDAAKFAAEGTPRGYMPEDSNTVLGEQYFYLQQPYYGASYLGGKHQIEEFMAERKADLGEDYSIKRFMDEMEASGLIPMSLIRWEITGRDDQIREMMDG